MLKQGTLERFLFAQAPLGVYYNLTISQPKKEIPKYIVLKYNLND
jgi:hypothetical protein